MQKNTTSFYSDRRMRRWFCLTSQPVRRCHAGIRNTVRTGLLLLWVSFLTAPMGAAPVSFAFSGYLDRVDNPSNAVPASIREGATFNGVMTYDPAAPNAIDITPATNLGDYYFSTDASFSLQVWIAGHEFRSQAPVPKVNFGAINVYYGANNNHALYYGMGYSSTLYDGAPFPGTYDQGGVELYFSDRSKTALSSDALLTAPPKLSRFPDSAELNIAFYQYKAPASLLYLTGIITNVTDLLAPSLTITPQPDGSLLLSWPLKFVGFLPQSNGSLEDESGWKDEEVLVVDTDTEHTAKIWPDASRQFLRLRAP